MSAKRQAAAEESPFEEQVVKVFRCATVVKGGRRFSFAAMVVVGDRQGQVGIGYGKANEVPPAVEKAIKDARKKIQRVNIFGTTIPHEVKAKYRATRVVLVPASEGTGVIAGSAARAVLELAGVHNVLTKVYGSTSAKNVVKATLQALQQLCSRKQIETLRGVTIPA
ncbi:MAG: 30S ribosomal protein S5 [Sedimentisphaerales bacterium]|nr:30S ribosomal protein S5 [Sedimentisphaerales bacterium]